VPERWCTVTVTDVEGRRHSLDLRATSTYDAAHLYCRAKESPADGFPALTLATVFAVVKDGRVYRVEGRVLQRWIVNRRQEWNGPRGHLFRQRPGLE
jgi:hypothetical protein